MGFIRWIWKMIKIFLWIVFSIFILMVAVRVISDDSKKDSNSTTISTYNSQARDVYNQAIDNAENNETGALKLLTTSCSEGYEEACTLLKYVEHIQKGKD